MSKSTQQILLPHGQSKKIGEALNVSQPTIREALRYQSNTEVAKRIRHTAVKEFGGVVYGDN